MIFPRWGDAHGKARRYREAAAAKELAKAGQASPGTRELQHYNRFRPHQGLMGRTPDEVYFDREPAIEKPRWEPRPKWPRTSGCAAPYVPVKGECGARLGLEVSYLEGRKHLPIFRLREAA